jgi:polysaccharide biosynthesis transport protein
MPSTQVVKALPPRTVALPTDEITISDLFGILRRRRMVIIVTMILLTIPPTLVGLWLEPKYTASALIVLEPPENQGSNGDAARGAQSPDAATIETQANILQSYPIVVQTMEELNLFHDWEFIPDTTPSKAAALLNPLSTMVADAQEALKGSSSTAADTVHNDTTTSSRTSPAIGSDTRNIAVAMFRDRLHVDQLGRSYVLKVGFTSADPAKAASVANQISTLYVQRQLQDKVAAAQKTRLWAFDALRRQDREVREAERRVAEFRAQLQLAASQASALAPSQIEELERELTRARAEQTKSEAKFALVKDLESRGGRLDAFAEAISSPLITQLRTQEIDLIRRDAELLSSSGDAHPKTLAMREELSRIAAQAKQEVERLIESMRNELEAQSTQVRNLESQLQTAKKQTADGMEDTVHLQELERDAAAKRSFYEVLFREYQQTSASSGNTKPSARIISPAEMPVQPSTPPAPIFAAVGFTVSALLGSLLALMREQTDRILRSSRQVEQRLHVPCLAVIPNVQTSTGGAKLLENLKSKPRAAYTQAVRGLYVHLTFTAPDAQVILVTSALPSEGKTSLAASLAVCAAHEGGRTVLVEFDLWNPKVASVFGLRAPLGVADLVAIGSDPKRNLDQALVIDQSTGIDILPAGSWEHSTTPVLVRQQVSALMEELRQRYDRIIIDAPPILGISDGRVVTPFSDAVLLAVRWGRTSRDAAAASLNILQDTNANVLGAVLTRVNLNRYSIYAHGDSAQYHQSYRKFYVE